MLALIVVLSTPDSLQDRLTQATVWASLLLYLPAILTTGLGFYGQKPYFCQNGLVCGRHDCTGVASALALDAVILSVLALSSLLTGLPVHIIMALNLARTLTTLAIVFFVVRVLYVCEIERRRETDQAIHERLRAQEEALRAQQEICQEIQQWSSSMTTMVRTVSSAISQPLDIGEIMDIVLSETLKFTGLQQGGIFIVDEKEQMLYQVAHQGIPMWFSDALSPLKVGDRLTGSVAKSGEMLIVDDIEQDPRASIPNSKDVHRFFVGVPLVAGGKVFGVMDLFHPTRHRLSKQQIALLAATGQQLGAAIETSRLYDELRGKAALEERWRLSRELHDDLLQVLGYLNLRSKVTQTLVPEAANSKVTEGLKDIERTTAQAYNDLRASILGLRVELPLVGDFVPALASYIQEFGERNHLHIVLDTHGWTAPSLPPETQVQITRVVQEALTNVRRHADASCAQVIFAVDGDVATIRVKDKRQGLLSVRSWG